MPVYQTTSAIWSGTDKYLIARGLQRETLAIVIVARGPAGCSWPRWQGLQFFSPFLDIFQDQASSPEPLQPLTFLHDFQHWVLLWVLLWVLGRRGATGQPGCPPHPTPGAQSRSRPVADLGDLSFSLVFGLRPSPCTAKEKADRLQSIKNILFLIWSPTGSKRRY